MPLVLDTGIVLALLNVSDSWHKRCSELLLSSEWDTPVIPSTVLVELDYFLVKRLPPAAWTTFYEDLNEGVYRLEVLEPSDFERALELVQTYRHIEFQLVDASVVALCERLGETRVATIDRRDFRIVTPHHCAAFKLLPSGPDSP